MPLTNLSYKVVVSQLEQPHRFDWNVLCNGNPACGWQAHCHNAVGIGRNAEQDAYDTAIYHLRSRHGFTEKEAQAAVTVTKREANGAQANPSVPPAGDVSRTNAAKLTPAVAKPGSGVVVQPPAKP